MKRTFQTMFLLLAIFFANNGACQSVMYSDSLDVNDLRIIHENNNIEVVGKKYEFINIQFDKRIKYKILTANGVRRIQKIILPETYDPSNIIQAPAARNYGYYFSDLVVSFFNVKIIHSNGEIEELNLKPLEREIKSVKEDDKYGLYYQKVFDIPGLKIYDEVEINYSYNVPFTQNIFKLLSFRIFFNGLFDKTDYQLTFKHDKELIVDFDYENSSEPDSVLNAGEQLIYKWNKNRIKGCMGEAGARPYLSLPYVVVSIKPSSLSYFVPNTFTKKHLPAYIIPVYYREKKHYSIIIATINNTTVGDYPAISRFVNKYLGETVKDTTGYYKIDILNREIVDKFTFDDNTAFFGDNYISDPEMGKSIGNQKLQDISRYNFYVAIVSKLGLFYYTAYVADKRSGAITEKYYAPMFEGDYLIAPQLKTSNLAFLYPKRANFGYYTDEIPFYFEGVKARLVCVEDYIDDQRIPINESFRSITTPKSIATDNSRRINIMVDVDAGKRTSRLNGKIILTGQYSTMSRGAYQNGYKDPSVNPMYARKIWEGVADAKLIKSEVQVLQKNFPYKTSVTCEYSSQQLVTIRDDSTFVIHLSGLFPHITNSILNEDSRVLDYFNDFLGQDMITYVFKFNKNVEIQNNIQQQKISNLFGEYQLESVLMPPDGIRITSCLTANAEKINASDISQVAAIFKAIQSLENSEITVKVPK
jgi:hypothetical protein